MSDEVVKLTDKQQMFVKEYLIDLNATQAALRAGYSEKTAYSIGHENLKKPEIAAAITKAFSARANKVEVTADYVFSTIIDTIERCKQEEPVLDKDGNETGEYVFNAAATLKGAELLGKHLKLFTDKVEHSGEVELNLAKRLQAAQGSAKIESTD